MVVIKALDRLLDKLVDLVISIGKFIKKNFWIILVIILAVSFYKIASILCHFAANIGFTVGIILLFFDSKRAIGKKLIVAALIATGIGLCLSLFGGIIIGLFKGIFKFIF